MSLSRGGLSAGGSDLKPGGGSGHLHKSWDPVVFSCPVMSSGLEACSPEPPATLGSSRSVASSEGVGDAVKLAYMDLKGEASKTSSSSNSIRWAIHLWRSLAMPCIMMIGLPACSAQCCRALANNRVCSFLASWMSCMPWKSWCSKKSLWSSALSLGGEFHQLDSSSWAAGSLKLAACLLASSCTLVWPSLPVHPC